MHRTVVTQRSFVQFLDTAGATDRWLFVIADDARSATNIFDALKSEILLSRAKLRWLTWADYTNRRFIKTRLQLDVDTIARLQALGDGDLSAGVEKLLGKPR